MGALARHGVGNWQANEHLPRHRHVQAYAALVLRGGYEECGSRGRLEVKPGDVVLHARFEAHLNHFRPSGADVFDLPLDDSSSAMALGRHPDPDAIMQLAERDLSAAQALLLEQLAPAPQTISDWPAALAEDLLADPSLALSDWARRHGLAAETVSRGFAKIFGISPIQFRLEARTHRALTMIAHSSSTLADIAAVTGFADQAHMSRTVRAMTGFTPCGLRNASNPFKTAKPDVPTSMA